MSFPPKVIGSFKIIPTQASERDFHGPWNKVMNHLFPPDSSYTVVPRQSYFVTATKEQSGLEESGNQPHLWFMHFEIQFESLPVLLLLASATAVVDTPLARELADAEVRKLIATSVDLCPLPTLRAISAFGPYLCMYTCDAAASMPEIYPMLIKKEDLPTNVAPRDRWSPDILTPDGQQALCELVDKIKAECLAEAETRS